MRPHETLQDALGLDALARRLEHLDPAPEELEARPTLFVKSSRGWIDLHDDVDLTSDARKGLIYEPVDQRTLDRVASKYGGSVLPGVHLKVRGFPPIWDGSSGALCIAFRNTPKWRHSMMIPDNLLDGGGSE